MGMESWKAYVGACVYLRFPYRYSHTNIHPSSPHHPIPRYHPHLQTPLHEAPFSLVVNFALKFASLFSSLNYTFRIPVAANLHAFFRRANRKFSAAKNKSCAGPWWDQGRTFCWSFTITRKKGRWKNMALAFALTIFLLPFSSLCHLLHIIFPF